MIGLHLLVIAVVGFGEVSASEIQVDNPFLGTWSALTSETISPDGTIFRVNPVNTSVVIFNETHYFMGLAGKIDCCGYSP